MRYKYSDEDVARLVELHKQEMPVHKIAKQLNMWTNTARRLLIESGYTPIYKECPQYGEEDEKEMVRLLHLGLNPNRIALKLKISPITVIRHLQKLGLGDKLTTKPVYGPEVQQQVIRLHHEGHTPNAIGLLLKINPSTVRRILRSAGIEPRFVLMHGLEVVLAILRLRSKGQSVTSISLNLGVPKSTVYYWLRKQPDYESKVYRKRAKKQEFFTSFEQRDLGYRAKSEISDQLILGVVRLTKAGFTPRQIAQKLKVTVKVVDFILNA